MSGPLLVIRADGGGTIGHGHLARCLALAQGWVDWGGRATLISTSLPVSWAELYRNEGVTIRGGSGWPADEERAEWAVIDGYQFRADTEHAARRVANRVLAIDDHGSGGDHEADVVLDQNLGADAETYTRGNRNLGTLIGVRFALLRREFRKWHGWERDIAPKARRLLVSLGGAPSDDARALVGEALATGTLANMEVLYLEGVDNVPAAMAEADVALSAAGSTCWELCCLGLPAVLLSIAENQDRLGEAMAQRGAAAYVGQAHRLSAADLIAAVSELGQDRERRQDMARRGRKLADGRGARRVVTAMRSALIRLRPAVEDDAGLLHEWANDPTVRAAAFRSEPIPWESHLGWLSSQLDDPSCRLFLAYDDDRRPVGQVRFEWDGPTAVVDVSVARSRRGEGLGPAVVDAGVRRLFAETPVETVVARVKPENGESRSAFEDADFILDDSVDAVEPPHVRYRRSRGVGVAAV